MKTDFFINFEQALKVATNDVVKKGLIASMSLMIILAVCLVAFLIWYKYKSTKSLGRGKDFEKELSNIIEKWTTHQGFYFLRPALYKNKNKLFELDGILVGSRGVFIIEMKSIQGDVIGDYLSNVWKKVKGPASYEIANHLRQNDKHIEHVQELLGEGVNIYSLLIYEDFSNIIEIKNIPDYALVFKENDFIKTMEEIKQQIPEEYSKDQISSFLLKLQGAITTSAKDKAKFISFFK